MNYRLWPKAVNSSNYYYIIVNIGISFFSFLRSFIFMRVLDMRELGIISLIQTIFMFIGLLQCGLLNGGYRIVSLGKKDEIEKTTNSIFSYVWILLPIGLLFCFLSFLFGWIKDLALPLLLISVIFGIFTLLNNWMHNCLIGEQKLYEVNRLNIVSYGTALLTLPLAFKIGFTGAVIVLITQPLLFVGLALTRNSELRPTGFFINKNYILYILSFGFIPFLSGIFPSLYLQFERWSITTVLGVESLGYFYLVFLYVSLFSLVPTSLNSIFFPKAVKAYSNNEFVFFRRVLRYYYLTLVAYSILILLATYVFLEPLVSIFFPNHLVGVGFVYIIVPGLVFKLMSDPLTLILNSAVILKPMLYIGVVTLVINVVAMFLLIELKVFTLDNISVLRSISGTLTLLLYILTYVIIKKHLYTTGLNQ